MERARLVWTGPSAKGLLSRNTRQVYEELVRGAHRTLWISSYVYFHGPEAFRLLAKRMDELPGMRVALMLNIRRSKGDSVSRKDVISRFADRFWNEDWPGGARPNVYYDPRSLDRDGPTSVLHAKAVVADEERLFVTSANLTEAAMDRNSVVEWGLGSRCRAHLLVENMTPAEYVSQRTWSILGRTRELRGRFGEESLTDLLQLAMLSHQRTKGFWLRSTTKQQEAWCGADLLVAVRHWTSHWSVFVMQAKKLYPDDKYRMLYGQKGTDQLNNLEQFARQLGALPLYLLYNHTNSVQPSRHWHCSQPFAAEQLGCTLVPSWHIRRMISGRSMRTFDHAHRVSQSMLWRCAFDCRCADLLLRQLALHRSRCDPADPMDPEDNFIPWKDWPFEPPATAWLDRLLRESTTDLTFEDFVRIRREPFSADYVSDHGAQERPTKLEESPLYPARLLLVDHLEES